MKQAQSPAACGAALIVRNHSKSKRASFARAQRWRPCLFALLVLLFGAAVSSAAPAHADEPAVAVRRYAIIASSNDGGPERVRLRFADTDARAM
ncbi:MAG TPA: hypothetical protein VMF89_05460, partial [Polyangiales bacterium]|nr:hypothetical protein [Polyangiales bacterium]